MREATKTIGGIVAAAPEDAVALLAPGIPSVTYGCLRKRISNYAAAVRAAGMRREDRVAVIVPNGPDLAISFLGVAAAAVCAPLNPAYTQSEFESYLADLNVRGAIVAPGQVKAVAALERLGIIQIEIARYASSARIEDAQPDDVALVLQTSGTTSRPKTVPLTHRNLCVSAANVATTLRLTAADRCLNIMPLFHIHGLVAALLAPLLSGGSVVCTPGFSATEFFTWLHEFQPAWYTAVPTMHQAILARVENNRVATAHRTLRFIRSASAALPPSVMQRLEREFHAPVIEAYGMTEAAHQMASNTLERRKPGTVGFAAGPSISVMDDAGNLLPEGAAGQIVIRGENVMRGYENESSANEAAFRHGWFHTGDLGFFDAEGYLTISGRLKEIINRGGEKISPREVDEALLEHPAVAEAVTFAIPHLQLGEAVGAAVVTTREVSELELREYAATRLAHFKIPLVVKIVAEIPKAATGKVQRTGLAERLGIGEIDEQAAQVEYSASGSEVEAGLQKMWTEILGVPRIGVHDNFFGRGGDSLAATILITRVASEFGVEPSFVRFLENPTIAGLAGQIAAQPAVQGPAKPASGLVPIQPEGARPPLFCISGHDGLPVALCNIARYLPPQQPMFSFPPRMPARRDGSYSLEELAAEYIGLMKQHSAAGPYRIAGYCFGGFVAFEMARQLRAQGEQVSLLALIDTYNPSGGRPTFRASMAQRIRHFRRRWRLQSEAVEGMGPLGSIQYVANRSRAFLREARFRVGYRLYRMLVRLRVPIPSFLLNVRYASSWALSRYRPKPYPGSALLLRVEDLRPDVDRLGWGEVIQGGLEILDSPYHNRGALTDPVARVMAAQLEAKLSSAS